MHLHQLLVADSTLPLVLMHSLLQLDLPTQHLVTMRLLTTPQEVVTLRKDTLHFSVTPQEV